MIKMPLSVVRIAAFCLPLALVASCGSESGAPAGSTIEVSPELREWTVGPPGACTNAVMQDGFFTIVVKNPSGAPLTGVDLRITLELAPGTFTGLTPVMYLFDDLDEDNVYTDLITGYPYFAQTGPFGTKMLRVQYDLSGCEYAGNLDVHSGAGAYGFVNISIENP